MLGAHLAGEPVGTRGFEEREGPLRDLDDADLWDALLDRMVTLNDVAAAAEEADADTDVAWTGRTMKVPWFAEHMREELAATAQRLLADRGSVVVTDDRDLLDRVEVLRGRRHRLNLRSHLLAFRRRGSQELPDVVLRERRSVQFLGSGRIVRVERGHHLPVVAGRVDDRIHGVCRSNPRRGAQRHCRTTNRGCQFA